MVTFILQEFWTDEWSTSLVAWDILSETTHRKGRENKKRVRKCWQFVTAFTVTCWWRRWRWPDFDCVNSSSRWQRSAWLKLSLRWDKIYLQIVFFLYLPNLVLTHWCSWCLMKSLSSALCSWLCDEHDLQHFEFIYHCKDHLVCLLSQTKMYSQALKSSAYSIHLCGTRRTTYNDPALMYEFCPGTESSCSQIDLAKNEIKCSVLVKCYPCLSYSQGNAKAFGFNKQTNIILSGEWFPCSTLVAQNAVKYVSWFILSRLDFL